MLGFFFCKECRQKLYQVVQYVERCEYEKGTFYYAQTTKTINKQKATIDDLIYDGSYAIFYKWM